MTTRKTLAPVILLVTVTLATFGLATWHPFTPDTAPAAEAEGDVTRGETVFSVNCSGCHGTDASGGVGPRSSEPGSRRRKWRRSSRRAAAVMPAGLVEGQDAADVAAYVASL